MDLNCYKFFIFFNLYILYVFLVLYLKITHLCLIIKCAHIVHKCYLCSLVIIKIVVLKNNLLISLFKAQ